MAKKKRKAHKGKARKAKKAKGHIPLKILEKRAKRLVGIVRGRGGKVAT
jgi:hypothetical protein